MAQTKFTVSIETQLNSAIQAINQIPVDAAANLPARSTIDIRRMNQSCPHIRHLWFFRLR